MNTPDLRNDHDEQATVHNGTLYRKGNVTQVWWTHDILGRPFDNTSPDPMKNGRETWTAPDEQQARTNFNAMKERWNEHEALAT